MNGLTVQIELLEPLLIGQFRAGDENSEKSFSYIPGSTLRGMFIELFMRTGQQIVHEQDALGYKLFFGDIVHYLNAYPTTPKGLRSLPTPRSLQGEEELIEVDGEEPTRNNGAPIIDSTFATIEELETLDRLKSPYCHLEGKGISLYNPKRRIGVHNASTKRFTKQSDDSTVFRYDSLEVGQTFSCVVLSDDQSLLDEHLRPLLANSDCFLGRSRSAGYGLVKITNIDIDDAWEEYQPVTESSNNMLTLTLLSDAILRDSSGQYTLDPASGCGWQFLPKHTFAATDTIGSFNRTWGLPTPQVPTLSAGSILYFENRPEISKALEGCVQYGIGERRNEGYGRVALNWLAHKEYKLENESPVEKSKLVIPLEGNNRKMARSMVQRLLQHQLDIQLTDQVNKEGLYIANPPENSQLSRLRLVVRDAWRNKDPELLPRFLKEMRQNAQNQFQKAKVGNKSLHNWLNDGWLDQIWTENFAGAVTSTPGIGDVSVGTNNELNREDFHLDALKLEYVSRLIDGMCSKAIRKKQHEQSQDSQGVQAKEGQMTEAVQ